MRYGSGMALNNSITVRFEPEQKRRLSEMAAKVHFSEADIIRQATEEYLQLCERRGAMIVPLNKDRKINYVAESHPEYGTKK
jgi:TRAP-type C4-dicarboxylate transport system substrate-binding protein